jgi:hypothetical protein
MSETVEAPGDDLRADLLAAVDTVEAPEQPGIGHNGGPEMEEERRDERGRFAGQAEEAPQEGAEAEETQEGGSEPADASKPPERLAVPDGWPSDAKLEWTKLPRAAQDAIKADLEAGRLFLKAPAQSEPAPDPVREVVQSYREQYQAKGLTPDYAVKALFEAQRFIEANPVEGLRWLAQSYGVPLETLAPNMQAGGGGYDPAIGQLQQELAQVKGLLTQQQRAAHEAQMVETHRTLEGFATAKGSDGQLLRPFFAEVKVTMGKMLENGTAVDLADAYEKAVLITPAVRTRMQEAESKAKAAREAAEQKRVAEEARRKAGSVKTSPSVQARPVGADDLRASLEAAFGG